MQKETVVFHVGGMMCKHCASHVEKALKEVQGVHSACVDLAQNTATVTFSTSATDIAALRAAIVGAGYEVIGE